MYPKIPRSTEMYPNCQKYQQIVKVDMEIEWFLDTCLRSGKRKQTDSAMVQTKNARQGHLEYTWLIQNWFKKNISKVQSNRDSTTQMQCKVIWNILIDRLRWHLVCQTQFWQLSNTLFMIAARFNSLILQIIKNITLTKTMEVMNRNLCLETLSKMKYAMTFFLENFLGQILRVLLLQIPVHWFMY